MCHSSFQTQGTSWFVIFSGAILGVTAAMLWTAQGQIMMSYPLEKDKGKAFAVFWAIFQMGVFIGSIIALAINIRDGKLSAVSTSTYIVSSYFILTAFAFTDLRVGFPRDCLHRCCFIVLTAPTTPSGSV